MDGGIGPLLLIALAAVACILAVAVVIGFVVFVILSAVGASAINDCAERKKRLASEAGSEDEW